MQVILLHLCISLRVTCKVIQEALFHIFTLQLQSLCILQSCEDPLLELSVVHEDLVRYGAEVLDQLKHVATFHLLAVVFAEDIVQFLLGHEAVPIGVNVPNGQGYLLQTIIIDHHIDKLLLCQGKAILDLLIDSVTMEVSEIAAQVSFQLFILLQQLDASVDFISLLILLYVEEGLHVDDAWITHVEHPVQFVDNLTLLRVKLDAELS